jgi:hypothetical protein
VASRRSASRHPRADTLSAQGEDAERAREFARLFLALIIFAVAPTSASTTRCRRMSGSVGTQLALASRVG